MTLRYSDEDLEEALKANPDITVHTGNPLPAFHAVIEKKKQNKYHAQRSYSELCQRWFVLQT